MSPVTLALVTHDGIATALLAQARRILGGGMDGTVVIEIGYDETPSPGELRARLDDADRGGGVLVLVDLPGATPSNQALEAVRDSGHRVVSGLNLPMLIRAWNYRKSTLGNLVDVAVEGGCRAIGELR